MRYKEEIYKNKKLIRINKKKVDYIINNCSKFNGLTIYMLPVKANPNSIMIDGFFELEIDFPYMDAIDYNRYIRECTFYNCGNELGTYLKFYIEKSQLERLKGNC